MSTGISNAYSAVDQDTDYNNSETLRIMQERMHECISASRHLIIAEEDLRKVHMVGVRTHELWKVGSDYVYYVECGFLVIEAHGQLFIVETKTGYLIDEYTKFGSISTMELLGKIQDADDEESGIYQDFQIAYRRMRGV